MYKEDTRVKITRNVAENTVWHSTHPDEGLIQTPIQEIRALVIVGLDQTPLGCNNCPFYGHGHERDDHKDSGLLLNMQWFVKLRNRSDKMHETLIVKLM